ncbi:MAG: DUF481 domain-containing protein [Verrucomicrobiales bacterium]|nr:DUF481 domain-containing protein [Verrucomicrobiales bacterium]
MKTKSVLLATFVALQTVFGALPARTEEDKSPLGPWTGSLDLGGNYLEGNSDLLHLYGGAKAERKWDEKTLQLELDGAYGKNNGIQDKKWISGSTQYNYDFNHPFYGGLFADALHDEIADLRYRVTVSPLLGIYLIKTDRTTLAFEAGPSYIFEEQNDVTDGYFAYRFAQRFEHYLSDCTKLWQSLEYRPEASDFANYQLIGEAGIQSWLSNRISAKAFLQNRYDNEPGAGQDLNDLGVYFALSYGSTKYRPGIAKPAHSPKDSGDWKFTGTAGGSILSGNTESSVYNAAFTGAKRSDQVETGFGLSGGYGKEATAVTAQQFSSHAFQNYDLANRWYIGGRTDFSHDRVAQLDYRVASGATLGYRLIDKPDCTSLKLEGGPGYIFEKQNGTSSYASLRFGEYFEHALSPSVKLFQSTEYQAALEDFEDYLLINKGGVDFCISKNWTWTNAVVHTYDNTPAPGLEESDVSVLSGIKWTF